ncbi:MAG: hypothetical protein QMC81_03790 [Thermoanaerobacterales bacterium]|nr:hypothetical protein [Bacillota bacterium]MDI6906602.1 hypothetical protein [Thermoanaerobacterales bacterium]
MRKNTGQTQWDSFNERECVRLPDGTFLPVTALTDEERAYLEASCGRFIIWVPHGRCLAVPEEVRGMVKRGRLRFASRRGGFDGDELLQRLESSFGSRAAQRGKA